MKANAETAIYVPAVGSGHPWIASGHSRAEAEFNYARGILAHDMRPAPYRFVIQYKVDQHDCAAHQRSCTLH